MPREPCSLSIRTEFPDPPSSVAYCITQGLGVKLCGARRVCTVAKCQHGPTICRNCIFFHFSVPPLTTTGKKCTRGTVQDFFNGNSEKKTVTWTSLSISGNKCQKPTEECAGDVI